MKYVNQLVNNIHRLIRDNVVILLVAALGFSITITSFWIIEGQFSIQRNIEFSWVAHNRVSLVKQKLEGALEPVRLIRDYVQSSGPVTADKFHLIAAPLLHRNTGIKMLGLILDTDNKGNKLIQPGDKPLQKKLDVYTILTHVEGRGSNLFKQGDDLASQPILGDTVHRAMQTGALTVSGRIKIDNQNENKYGVMVCLPIYTNTLDTTQESQQNNKTLLGFVVAVLKLDELSHSAISYLEPRGVDLLILDDSDKKEARFLEFYASRLNSIAEFQEQHVDNWLNNKKTLLTEVVEMGNRKWSISAAANENFRSAEAFEEGPLVVLFGGILLTLLVSIYLLKMKLGLQERHRMDQLLKDREELFWQMSETVDDVFWAIPVDRGHFLYVSPAFESMWGIKCQKLYDDPGLFSDAIHPDDRAGWLNALDNAVRESGSMEAIYRVTRPDGSQRWVRDNAFPVHDASGNVYRLVGVAEDITEKKQAEDALRESENKLRTMFNQSPDRIMTVNEAGKILIMNRGAALEFPDIRGRGRHSADLFPAAYQGNYRQLLEQVLQKGEIGYFQYQSGEGSTWLEIRIVPISENSEVHAAMVIVTDITEKRNFQAQAMRNARLASIGVIAAGVAHEINNPNNAIQISAALFSHVWADSMPVLREYYQEQGDFSVGGLSFAEEGDSLGELISEIKDNSRRIKVIVENLKHLGKNDQGDLNEEVDINKVLRSAARVLKNSISKYTHNWEMKLSEGIPLVKGNSQQLEQVFMNVMLNALQSLPDKNLSVSIESTSDPENKSVLIRIVDQGAGIAEEDILRVTEPFFTTRLEAGGTGLGLSISNTIIENHRGSIDFKSSMGTGTQVSIKLPAI